jgi:hypothetical protein
MSRIDEIRKQLQEIERLGLKSLYGTGFIDNTQYLLDELKERKCKHENTVHGELIGLTHFELCLDCGLSRSETENDNSDWMVNEVACLNIKRQFNKQQAEIASKDKKINSILDIAKNDKDALNETIRSLRKIITERNRKE